MVKLVVQGKSVINQEVEGTKVLADVLKAAGVKVETLTIVFNGAEVDPSKVEVKDGDVVFAAPARDNG